jgi:hypothetical protein
MRYPEDRSGGSIKEVVETHYNQITLLQKIPGNRNVLPGIFYVGEKEGRR